MAARALNLFSIPPGASFLDALADALIAGRLVGDIGWKTNPLAVADVTIYLPTRRAARAFAGVLAARADGPAILPRITPLGDADEAELRLIGDGDFIADIATDSPPAGDAERLVVLADLIMRWRDQLALAVAPLGPDDYRLVAGPAAESFALAADLARILDTLAIEGVSAEAIESAVPGEHDRYWSISREFLAIATRVWPAWLDANGLSDPVARRNEALRRRAAQVAAGGGGPIVAAGSTGTNPATAALLAAIARHPRGAVVLPALDLVSSDDSFAAVAAAEAPQHGHPQATLATLMKRLSATRGDVKALGEAPAPLLARERVLAQAMQPPSRTAAWSALRGDARARADIAAALDDVAIIEAANEREEALAIALAMRETIETPGRTAALATPDRALAERVGVALKRWGIEVADSAGRSLARSPRGSLAALAARWLADPADGALLMALVVHPCVGCGLSRRHMDRAAAAIDIGLLRGYPPVARLDELRALLPKRREGARKSTASGPARRLSKSDWADAERALDALIAIERGFAAATAAKAPLSTWIAAHRAALEALTTDGDSDRSWLHDERDGAALRDLLDALAAPCEKGRAPMSRRDYPGVVAQLLDSVILSPPAAAHPRLSIWGLLEARLLAADRLILGGLNEATWPPAPRPDAFLNRALRATLDLPQPERRIGQTAHDFVSILGGARDAIMTRAQKAGGAPTVPSRFWQRLAAYAGPREKDREKQTDADRRNPWSLARTRGEAYVAWARALDESGEAKPIARPTPKPPPDLVPRRLSVSRIETLVRDPYAIFARSVLALDPLPAPGVAADAALRGTLIHDAVAEFARAVDPFAPDALDRLIDIGERLFAEAGVDPERILFWRPRFERAARLYLDWERERRPFIANGLPDVERPGELVFPLADGTSFTLSARADRIERLKDGTLAIVDFKTGAPPSRKEAQSGFAPQLTLEAAMATRGAFAAEDKGRRASALIYVRMGGSRSGGFAVDLATPPARGEALDPVAIPEKHLDQLRRRMDALIAGERAFVSREYPNPRRPEGGGDYDHLARVAEWSRGGDGDE